MTRGRDPVQRDAAALFDLLVARLGKPGRGAPPWLPAPSRLAPVARFGGFGFNRLELLGDTVLEQVVLESALPTTADASELQDAVSARTSDDALASIATRLGLDDLLREVAPEEELSMAADAVEALGGACFEGGGWGAVEDLAQAIGLTDGLDPRGDAPTSAPLSGRGLLVPALDHPGQATLEAVEDALGVHFSEPAWVAHALFPDRRQAVLAAAGSHVLEVALVLDLIEAHPDDNAYELSRRIGRARRVRDVIGRLRRSPLSVVLGDGTVARSHDDETEDEAYDAARALVGAALIDGGRASALTATRILRP